MQIYANDELGERICVLLVLLGCITQNKEKD